MTTVHAADPMTDDGLLFAVDGTYTMCMIPAGALKIDREYQRPLSPSWVERHTWEPILAEAIRVNQRPDGTFWVVDGQHRLALARKADVKVLKCNLYHFATKRIEAHYFRYWNSDLRKARTNDVFLSAVAEGDQTALDIVRIVETNGYHVEYGNHQGHRAGYIGCVETLMVLYRGYDLPGRTGGPARLQRVLQLVRRLWGEEPTALTGIVLEAVALFLRRYGSLFDEQRLANALIAHEPKVMIAQARADNARVAGSEKRSTRNLFVLAMWEAYNKGLKSRRLPHPFWGGEDAKGNQ